MAWLHGGSDPFWKDMKRNTPAPGGEGGRLPVFRVLGEILSHSNFSGCGTQKVRKWAHMLVFFGFALLILVTLYAIWASITHNYPLPLINPFKMAGNVASLMIYCGLGIMIFQRITNKDVFGKSGYTDWLLLIAIGVLTLSGTLVEMARFGNWTLRLSPLFLSPGGGLVCDHVSALYKTGTCFLPDHRPALCPFHWSEIGKESLPFVFQKYLSNISSCTAVKDGIEWSE